MTKTVLYMQHWRESFVLIFLDSFSKIEKFYVLQVKLQTIEKKQNKYYRSYAGLQLNVQI